MKNLLLFSISVFFLLSCGSSKNSSKVPSYDIPNVAKVSSTDFNFDESYYIYFFNYHHALIGRNGMVGVYAENGSEVIPITYNFIIPLGDKYYDAGSPMGHAIYTLEGVQVAFITGSIYGVKDDIILYEPLNLGIVEAMNLSNNTPVLHCSRNEGTLHFVWQQPFIIKYRKKDKHYDLYDFYGKQLNPRPIIKIEWGKGKGKINAFHCKDNSYWKVDDDYNVKRTN